MTARKTQRRWWQLPCQDREMYPSKLVGSGFDFSWAMTTLAPVLGRRSSGWSVNSNLSVDLWGWTCLSLYKTDFLLYPCLAWGLTGILGLLSLCCLHLCKTSCAQAKTTRTMAQQQQIRYEPALIISTAHQTLQHDSVCRLLNGQNRNKACLDYLPLLLFVSLALSCRSIEALVAVMTCSVIHSVESYFWMSRFPEVVTPYPVLLQCCLLTTRIYTWLKSLITFLWRWFS